MSTNVSAQTDSPSILLRGLLAVCAAIPAAFLTWLAASLGKDPSDFIRHWGYLLPCSVILAGSLLALAADAGVRQFDPSTTWETLMIVVGVSFITSMLAFLAITYFVL